MNILAVAVLLVTSVTNVIITRNIAAKPLGSTPNSADCK